MAGKSVNRTVPRFRTEAEEAQWWYDNREKHADEFIEAMRAGKTKRLTKDVLGEQIKSSQSIPFD